jgi:hypothetical protein
MSSIEFLSHEEVCLLTGARTKSGQVTVLKRNGIRHTIKLNGWPSVITAVLMGNENDQPLEKVSWQPRKAG